MIYIPPTYTAISGLIPTCYNIEPYYIQGDFTVLPYWKTGQPGPGPDIPVSHIILTLSKPVVALSCKTPGEVATRINYINVLISHSVTLS